MFQYLKWQIVNNGIIFLLERHSSEQTFNERWDEFKGDIFYEWLAW